MKIAASKIAGKSMKLGNSKPVISKKAVTSDEGEKATKTRHPIVIDQDKVANIDKLIKKFEEEFEEFKTVYAHFLYEPKKNKMTPFAKQALVFKKTWGEIREVFKSIRDENTKFEY